jgi:hypothetical protein
MAPTSATNQVAMTQCSREITTCPVCAGQRRYYVLRKLWVAGWFGGHCQMTRKTMIRCDVCDGTGTITRSALCNPARRISKNLSVFRDLNGRSERIRTSGPCVPNTVL